LSSPYSPLKVFHHPRHIEALRENIPISPLFVEVIPTDICNNSCPWCAYRTPGYSSNEMFDPRRSIPFDKLVEIVDDCEQMGVRAVEVTGGGEPTCHPQFLSLCDAITESGMDLGVVTNGSRWTDKHVQATQKAKWVRFSIDAGKAETYAVAHGTQAAAFERVREAVRSQVASSHAADQLVGVSFTVTVENYEEVVLAAENAKRDGADNLRLGAVFQDAGSSYFAPFQERATALCRAAESLTDGKFRVFNCFEDRVKDLKDGSPDYTQCHFQKLCTYIGADLNVYRCCVLAYNHQGLLGSIKDRRFRYFWHSSETQAKLNDFDARECPRCMFNNKNCTIQYAVDSQPTHVNFL
jgi:MoaA/NifB/PqqE/SkfB family radical SAM enzyme